jgi:hypothetical protein
MDLKSAILAPGEMNKVKLDWRFSVEKLVPDFG